MSTHRCDHGNVISDRAGEYRCYECQPFGPADLETELQATERVIEERLAVRDARIAELERVVAQLCERNGIIFDPPNDEDGHPLADAMEANAGPMGVQPEPDPEPGDP